MVTTFTVLHFGAQCPWHLWVIEQARLAALQVGGVTKVIDVSIEHDSSHRYQLFFPFMTVINDALRLPSPLPTDQLVQIAREGIEAVATISIETGNQAWSGRVEPLTSDNIADTCALCIPDRELRGCRAKTEWASQIQDTSSDSVFGFIVYEADKVVGAVEYYPSPWVPYPLPQKDSSLAFITCIYSLEDGLDYRGQLISPLKSHLSQYGYKRLQVIAGRHTPYPNGPVSFFVSHGFKELIEIDRVLLREGWEELVLMESIL